MTETLPAPRLEHLCDLAVTIAAPVEVGQTSAGLRRMIPITGGTVTGARVNGKVLAGGADFQLILDGGTQAHLDARYVIELDDGSRVFVLGKQFGNVFVGFVDFIMGADHPHIDIRIIAEQYRPGVFFTRRILNS